MHSFQTIGTFTKDLIQAELMHNENLPKNIISPVPIWEIAKANYDIHYCNVNKNHNAQFTAVEARYHIYEKYSGHLKIYTDGSVFETGEAGSAFVIPDFNISESYYLCNVRMATERKIFQSKVREKLKQLSNY